MSTVKNKLKTKRLSNRTNSKCVINCSRFLQDSRIAFKASKQLATSEAWSMIVNKLNNKRKLENINWYTHIVPKIKLRIKMNQQYTIVRHVKESKPMWHNELSTFRSRSDVPCAYNSTTNKNELRSYLQGAECRL